MTYVYTEMSRYVAPSHLWAYVKSMIPTSHCRLYMLAIPERICHAAYTTATVSRLALTFNMLQDAKESILSGAAFVFLYTELMDVLSTGVCAEPYYSHIFSAIQLAINAMKPPYGERRIRFTR